MTPRRRCVSSRASRRRQTRTRCPASTWASTSATRSRPGRSTAPKANLGARRHGCHLVGESFGRALFDRDAAPAAQPLPLARIHPRPGGGDAVEHRPRHRPLHRDVRGAVRGGRRESCGARRESLRPLARRRGRARAGALRAWTALAGSLVHASASASLNCPRACRAAGMLASSNQPSMSSSLRGIALAFVDQDAPASAWVARRGSSGSAASNTVSRLANDTPSGKVAHLGTDAVALVEQLARTLHLPSPGSPLAEVVQGRCRGRGSPASLGDGPSPFEVAIARRRLPTIGRWLSAKARAAGAFALPGACNRPLLEPGSCPRRARSEVARPVERSARAALAVGEARSSASPPASESRPARERGRACTRTGRARERGSARSGSRSSSHERAARRLSWSASSRSRKRRWSRHEAPAALRAQGEEVLGVAATDLVASPPRRAARARTRGSSPASRSATPRGGAGSCRAASRACRGRRRTRPRPPPACSRRRRRRGARTASARPRRAGRSSRRSSRAASAAARAGRARRRSAAAAAAPGARAAAGGSTFTRAAASSIASGSPSSRAQIAATAGRSPSSSRPRSLGEQDHSSSAASGGTEYSRSAPIPSGSRLVARRSTPANSPRVGDHSATLAAAARDCRARAAAAASAGSRRARRDASCCLPRAAKRLRDPGQDDSRRQRRQADEPDAIGVVLAASAAACSTTASCRFRPRR